MWQTLVVPVRWVAHLPHLVRNGPVRLEAEPAAPRDDPGVAADGAVRLPLPPQTNHHVAAQGAPPQERRLQVGSRAYNRMRARCSSVVRAFAHGAMGHRINPSWGGPIELFLVPASAP